MNKVAITEMAMGAWKWGYPKGHRQGISTYVPRRCKNGKWIWSFSRQVCNGLTASNEATYREIYPEAWENFGSLHNRPLSIEDLRKMALEKLLKD